MTEPKLPRRLRPLPPAIGGGPPVIPGPRPPAPATPVASAPPAGPAQPAASREDERSRNLIRPSLQARPSKAGGGVVRRREAPPDTTGAEAALLARLVSSGATVEVRLCTGDVVRGQIEWADRSCLKLRRSDARSVVVMKSAVVALSADGLVRPRG